MWDAEKSLIQVDLGTAVAEAITPPDERGAIAKWINPELPPKIFDRILKLCNERINNLESEELITPTPIVWDVDKDINPQAFRIYIGISGENFNFNSSLEELHSYPEGRELIRNTIIDTLEQEIRKNQKLLDREAVKQSIFNKCLTLVSADDYTSAFEEYQRVYYSSYIQNFIYEHIHCLSDVSYIFLRNGDYSRAYSVLQRAIKLCDEEPNVVDIHLKAQVAYGNAQILNRCGEFSQANDYYVKALEEAEKLILSQGELDNSDPMWKRAYELERMIRKIEREIKDQEIKQLAQDNSKSSFNEITQLIGVILNSLIPATVNTIVYKLFGISGTYTLAIFGSAEYNFGSNNLFVNKPSGWNL